MSNKKRPSHRTVIVPGMLISLDGVLELPVSLLGLGVLELDLWACDLRQDVPHLGKHRVHITPKIVLLSCIFTFVQFLSFM